MPLHEEKRDENVSHDRLAKEQHDTQKSDDASERQFLFRWRTGVHIHERRVATYKSVCRKAILNRNRAASRCFRRKPAGQRRRALANDTDGKPLFRNSFLSALSAQPRHCETPTVQWGQSAVKNSVPLIFGTLARAGIVTTPPPAPKVEPRARFAQRTASHSAGRTRSAQS